MKPVYFVLLLGIFFLIVGFPLSFVLENIWFMGLTLLGMAILVGVSLIVLGGSEAADARDRMFVKAQEAKVEALCEHLRRIGLEATVESKERKNLGPGAWLVGSVKIGNRNVDLVELQEWATGVGDDYGARPTHVGCFFVVREDVKGLADELTVEGEGVKKSFWSRQVVDFKWKGKELAQVLNSDAELRSLLLSQRRLHRVKITPSEQDHCVRISQKDHSSPAKAFPTIEEFKVCDRIAQHIRSIANVRP